MTNDSDDQNDALRFVVEMMRRMADAERAKRRTAVAALALAEFVRRVRRPTPVIDYFDRPTWQFMQISGRLMDTRHPSQYGFGLREHRLTTPPSPQ